MRCYLASLGSKWGLRLSVDSREVRSARFSAYNGTAIRGRYLGTMILRILRDTMHKGYTKIGAAWSMEASLFLSIWRHTLILFGFPVDQTNPNILSSSRRLDRGFQRVILL